MPATITTNDPTTLFLHSLLQQGNLLLQRLVLAFGVRRRNRLVSDLDLLETETSSIRGNEAKQTDRGEDEYSVNLWQREEFFLTRGQSIRRWEFSTGG